MKIISIVGARPQFIKSAPLSIELKKRGDNEIVIHTGQHYDPNMSEVFFKEMSIPKEKYNLGINNLSHAAMTGRMMERIENILIEEKPDFLLVYGDTNSTLAGSLAASKMHIPIIHVEAGLRSFNRRMPEELNRILTDNLSTILFCPSDVAVSNLNNEGISEGWRKISIVGDIMKDTIHLFSQNQKAHKVKNDEILVTLHREENVKSPQKLKEFVAALNELSRHYHINFPIHPSTKNALIKNSISLEFSPIEPQSFTEMIGLINRSKLIITDSGGLQKESYYLNKPALILRDDTEWVELLAEDINTLCPLIAHDIVNEVTRKINEKYIFNPLIYGDGRAAKSMANIIVNGG